MSHRTIFFFSLALLLLGFYFTYWLLLPLILSSIIAYLFSPVKKKLIQLGLSNISATLLIIIPLIGLLITVAVLVFPALKQEIIYLLRELPSYLNYAVNNVQTSLKKLNITPYFAEFDSKSFTVSSALPNLYALLEKTIYRIISTTSVVSDVMVYTILIPIFSFYLIKDWEFILAYIARLVPIAYKKTFYQLTTQIDVKLASYIRGQVLLSVIFAFYYTVCFNIVGLAHGTLIGLLTGLFFFIPVLTFFVSLITCSIIAYIQFGFDINFIFVMTIFGLGQILENFVLVPKVMGNKLNINTVWVLFSLYAGSKLLGAVGLLIAIPVTAILSVLLKFGHAKYLESRYYNT